MTLCFTLTMPNRGSWNGRWSGENSYYAVTRTLANSKRGREKAATLAGKSFYYRWDDGWGASVSVRAIDGHEARSVRKKSKGFCGYDWMVDSILKHGAIYGSKDEIPEPAKEARR